MKKKKKRKKRKKKEGVLTGFLLQVLDRIVRGEARPQPTARISAASVGRRECRQLPCRVAQDLQSLCVSVVGMFRAVSG